jgi:hypothetical protein
MYLGIDNMSTIATQLTPSVGQNNPLRFSSSFGLHFNHELIRNKIYAEYGFYSIDRGYGYSVNIYNQNGNLIGKYRTKKKFLCFSIPIKIGIKFKDIYIDLGPSFDYIYAERTKDDEIVVDNTISENTNRILFGGNLSIGTNYVPKYFKGLMFSIGAYSNITLQPMFLNIGVKFGIKFRLK